MNTSKYKHKNMQPKIQNVNYKKYHNVSEFKYLGSLVSCNNDCGRDLSKNNKRGSILSGSLKNYKIKLHINKQN
jgi:hypothetical protein